MAFKFVSTKKMAELNGVKVLVYGRAGTGKTRMCATAPNPVILSAEAGLLSLKEFDIPAINITSIEQIEEVYDWLVGSKEAKKFDTVCLDSLSEIGEVILDEAKPRYKDARQAYGELIERIHRIVKQFRDLSGKHVYFTAKEQRIKDEDKGVIFHQPSMPGAKLGTELAYYFDEVFHLDIGEGDKGTKYRYLQTAADFRYDAKDRSGCLDEKEKPDLTYIFNKIVGVKGKK